jgi:hypothetical protein
MTDPDFYFDDQGSLIGLTPRSSAAHDWIDENLSVESWQRLGPAIMIDHGMAQTVLEAIEADGFTLSRSAMGAMDIGIRRDRIRSV